MFQRTGRLIGGWDSGGPHEGVGVPQTLSSLMATSWFSRMLTIASSGASSCSAASKLLRRTSDCEWLSSLEGRWWVARVLKLEFPLLEEEGAHCRGRRRDEIKSGSGWSIEVGPGQEQICIWSTDGGVRRRSSLWGRRRRRRRRWGSSFAKSWRPLACSPFWLRQVRKEYFAHGCQFSYLDISLNS